MRLSLGKKIVLLLVVFVISLGGIVIGVSYNIVDSMNEHHFLSRANEIAATVARVIDGKSASKLAKRTLDTYHATTNKVMSDEWGTDEFDEYVGNFSALRRTAEFKTLMSELKKMQEPLDVDCLYLAYVEPHDEVFMYLVDAAEEDPCPIGCLDPIYETNQEVLHDPTVGFPAYITDTEEYGWLVTAGVPVYDGDDVACYALVDISMDMIKQREKTYLLGLIGGLASIVVLLSGFVIFFISRSVVRPINALSSTASRYCSPERGQRTTFEELDIHTGDEIESLYLSMVQMEHDIDSYINNLAETQTTLKYTQLQADVMNNLAHTDALTGVRNKLAYDQEVFALERGRTAGQQEFGLVVIDLNDLKAINDRYGHDRGDISIRRLSGTICAVFAHSPVFRIGGDEFVVVLRNNDYHNIEALVDEFQAALGKPDTDASSSLEPWENIRAAIGYALYDPAIDTDVSSVFRRADEQMYAHKKAMKGGAEPR